MYWLDACVMELELDESEFVIGEAFERYRSGLRERSKNWLAGTLKETMAADWLSSRLAETRVGRWVELRVHEHKKVCGAAQHHLISKRA
jgi:hypothetical protein